MNISSHNDIKVGDVILYLSQDGGAKLAICIKPLTAYERQGGEGPVIQFETGQKQQYSYVDTGQSFMVIDHIEKRSDNPLRDLLIWRQKYEM